GAGAITGLRVTLNNLSSTWPDTVDILLVGPNGGTVVLMSDAGGGAPMVYEDVTFQDSALPLPDSGQIVSGTYRPTDYEVGTDVFAPPAPAGPYGTSLLGAFAGSNPNGVWSLYVMHDGAGDPGAMHGGWSLTIEGTCGSVTPTPLPPTRTPTTIPPSPTRTSLTASPTPTPGCPLTFSNPQPITINIGGPAYPYPSNIGVAGLGAITGLRVTLINLYSTWPDQLDVLLVGPNGGNVLLMSDTGGSLDVNGINLTFQDGAPALPDGGQIVGGTYRPTDYEVGDTFPAPAPVGPYGTNLLIAFGGSNPNGVWSLFIVHDGANDVASIAGGWSLTIETACGSITPTIVPLSATRTATPPSATATRTAPTGTATRTAVPPTATPTVCPGGGPPAPWAAAAPYPVPNVRYGFAQVGDSFYVIGGFSNGTLIADVRRYDIATGQWTSLAPIPVASEAPACAYNAATNKIYCAEGNTGNSFQIYDVAGNTWTQGPAVPGAADHYGAAAGSAGTRVYIVGGGKTPSADVEVYDTAGNTWSPGTPAPSPIVLAGYQTVGQDLYLVGGYGYSPLGAAGSSVLARGKQAAAPQANNTITTRLDMTTGAWTVGPAWLRARADFALAYSNSKLYALGGDAPFGGYFDSTNLVDELNVAAWPGGGWTAAPPLLPAPNRQANQAGFSSSDGRIWSTGGVDGATFTLLAEHLYRTAAGPPCATATATPVPPSATRTVPVPPSSTMAPSRTEAPTVTRTAVPPSGTAAPSSTPGGPTVTPCTITFTDVPPTDAFYSYIRCLVCRGIISGYADNTFRGGQNLTRGQAAKIISNAAGFSDAVPSTQQSFQDVPMSDPFWVFIERLASRGYISGYQCGFPPAGSCAPPANRPYFLTYANITRGQISKVVANAAGLNNAIPSTQQTFADVPHGNAFWIYIERLAALNVISGYNCGGPGEPCDGQNRPYYRWTANVTRNQAAKIVANTFFPACQTPQR
ncbi:MAG TPA: S-layer homology domain-containing protein, partial [Chloroflexia bacterium]|nr:S-layer homology domain-containing protein [Chloroflexia bacterium]